jgi:hypothetical protein
MCHLDIPIEQTEDCAQIQKMSPKLKFVCKV